MARVEISEAVSKQAVLTVGGSPVATVLQAGAGASVLVKVRGGGAATIYQAATGATTVANPQPADAFGRIAGYVDPGPYDLEVSIGGVLQDTHEFEAVSAASALAVESGGRTAVNAEAPLNVEWPEYGADSAASDATNRAAIQAAIDVAEAASGARQILFPSLYRIDSTPLTVETSGLEFLGLGKTSTGVKSATGDVFRIGTAAGSCIDLTFEAMKILSESGGGHCFAPQFASSAVGISKSRISNCYIANQNTGKSLWHQAEGIYIDMLVEHCDLEHVLSATVPGWNLIAAVSIQNRNTWKNLRCTNSGEFFFYIECTGAASMQENNAFRDINFEVCNGGAIKGLSTSNLLIENCAAYDLGTTTRDLIYIGAGSGAFRSIGATIKHFVRSGGTLGGGLNDIKLQSGKAPFSRVERSYKTSFTGFTMDQGANTCSFEDNVINTRTNPPVLSTVASAATITVSDVPVQKVSGTADITSINVSYTGHRITLIFTGTAATNGLVDGSNLKLAGNLAYTPDDTITLVCDGTNWHETGRAVN